MEFHVRRYMVTGGDPDRLSVSKDGAVILDISMSSDSPLKPFLSANEPRPWFYTGSPYGKEIVEFCRQCGVMEDQHGS